MKPAGEAPSLDQARRTVARILLRSADIDPDSPRTTVLRQLANLRSVAWDLLAASASDPDDEPQVPMALLRFCDTWDFAWTLDVWVAERVRGNTIRVIADRDPADLAAKLAVVEFGPAGRGAR